MLHGVPQVRAWNALLLVAFIAGTALRAWQLDIQILIDDEWHAIHKLLRSGPLDIATHLGYADYSIPLTLYFQQLQRTIGLSEWEMHVPSLIAGIGLLLVGPRLLARSFRLPVCATWTTLVAISPLLVYHSKIARPYALTSLLTFVAIVSFRSWWLGRRNRDAALYAATAFLAGWLHAITLPFTLMPLVFYGARALYVRDGCSFVALVKLGAITAFALAVVLAPPLVVDWTQFSSKAGRGETSADSLYRGLLMLAGTGVAPVGMFMFAVAGFGWWRVWRRERELAWYVALICGVGTAVVASSGAEWISHPLVLARYLIPVVPFLLLFVAEGVVALVATPRFGMGAFAAGAIAVALFATGPIPDQWHYPNQFWGHLRYQFDYDPGHNPYVVASPAPVPAFYAELGKLPPGTVTLIETPWRLESHFNALSLYQDTHRQKVKIGLVTPLCGTYDFGEYPEDTPGMKMRWLAHLTAVLRGETYGADYLVVHATSRDVAANPPPPWPDLRGCLPALEAKLGAPIYRDARITVYQLSQLSPLGNTRPTMQQ